MLVTAVLSVRINLDDHSFRFFFIIGYRECLVLLIYSAHALSAQITPQRETRRRIRPVSRIIQY